MGSNVTAAWKAHKRGAFFANPCYTQIHPTCIPVSGDHQSKLTLMSESLRNDGRIWVPKKLADAKAIQNKTLKPTAIAEEDRDYFLERRYPAFGNLVPRDVASRAAKERCDAGFGVNATGEAVYLDFAAAIVRYGKEQVYIKGLDEKDESLVKSLGKEVVKGKYGNLFQMYEKIVDENPYETPMMIYPAVHFVLPYTIGDYLANDIRTGPIPTDTVEFEEAEANVRQQIKAFINNKGTKPVDYFHKKLGKIMWNKCGMARNEKDLKEAIEEISALRESFYKEVRVPGSSDEFNEELAKAGRVADFLELGELFAKDALAREESAGGHFREEHQTKEGEAKRRKEFQFVSAWEYKGAPKDAKLHKEALNYEDIEVKERSYK